MHAAHLLGLFTTHLHQDKVFTLYEGTGLALHLCWERSKLRFTQGWCLCFRLHGMFLAVACCNMFQSHDQISTHHYRLAVLHPRTRFCTPIALLVRQLVGFAATDCTSVPDVQRCKCGCCDALQQPYTCWDVDVQLGTVD